MVFTVKKGSQGGGGWVGGVDLGVVLKLRRERRYGVPVEVEDLERA